MNIRQELAYLQKLIYQGYSQGAMVSTVMIEENQSTPMLFAEMEKLVSALEKSVLRARSISEYCYLDSQVQEKKAAGYEKEWSGQTPTGRVRVDENGWLHITIDTLLPHCRKRNNPWLRDTLKRLLHGYQQNGGKLPYFERAMLVINEHCNIENRQVFDQDNKGWKMIPNVLKGLVIADDDQFSLGISLVSTLSDTPACHIYVMDMADANAYFSLYSGDCGSYFNW